jgi:hypothetical protein
MKLRATGKFQQKGLDIVNGSSKSLCSFSFGWTSIYQHFLLTSTLKQQLAAVVGGRFQNPLLLKFRAVVMPFRHPMSILLQFQLTVLIS